MIIDHSQFYQFQEFSPLDQNHGNINLALGNFYIHLQKANDLVFAFLKHWADLRAKEKFCEIQGGDNDDDIVVLIHSVEKRDLLSLEKNISGKWLTM